MYDFVHSYSCYPGTFYASRQLCQVGKLYESSPEDRLLPIFQADQIVPGFALANDPPLVTFNQNLRRTRASIIGRSHHCTVGTRVQDCQQIARLEWRKHDVRAQYVSAL